MKTLNPETNIRDLSMIYQIPINELTRLLGLYDFSKQQYEKILDETVSHEDYIDMLFRDAPSWTIRRKLQSVAEGMSNEKEEFFI